MNLGHRIMKEVGVSNGADYDRKLGDGRIDGETLEELLEFHASESGVELEEVRRVFHRALSGIIVRKRN